MADHCDQLWLMTRIREEEERGFLSLVSVLTRDIDKGILSVRPSVCLSIRDVPVSDENGLTYRHRFFTIR